MKIILLLALLSLGILSAAQTGAQESADLVVLKFSCGVYDPPNRVIRSVQEPDPPMNEPMVINRAPAANEPQELKNRRDMDQRRAEMRAAEANAKNSAEPTHASYFYRLQFRNAGLKAIKNFSWEYQPSEAPDPLDRQFFCAIKAKPGESKELELYSPLPPSHLIDASKVADKSNKDAKDSKGKVIINRIEYVDGTFWNRHGWNPATFPKDSMEQVANGKCIGL
jgi:hypothetical protein